MKKIVSLVLFLASISAVASPEIQGLSEAPSPVAPRPCVYDLMIQIRRSIAEQRGSSEIKVGFRLIPGETMSQYMVAYYYVSLADPMRPVAPLARTGFYYYDMSCQLVYESAPVILQ